MKIVFLGVRGFPNVQGGVEKHCEELSTRLVKLGCEVIVFTRKPYVNKNIKEYKGVRLIALPAIRHKSLEAFCHTFIGLFAALQFKPDILHIQSIGPAFFTPLARIFGMKVVITSHGSNYKHLKWGKFARLVLRAGELLGVVFANQVIAVSKTIANELKVNYNRVACIIPNGVEIPDILESKGSLEKYSLTEDRYILAVGRYVPEKGFGDLIEAFRRANLDNCRLVIIGDADHESNYSRDLREAARKNQNVVLTGFLRGKPLQEIYSHAGLFVLPSYYEGMPIVLLEAMSYGLLCLASDIEANRNISLPIENHFKAGDIDQLSGKLKVFFKRSLSREEKRKQIEMLRQKYDWNEIARKTFGVYRRIAIEPCKLA